jgi:hypothetical protein
MSWEEHDRLVRELGIPAADRNSPALRGFFGTTFLPGRFHISISTEPEPSITEERRAMRARVAQLAERGEELSECPFVSDDGLFGEGTQVEIAGSTLENLLARRYGGHVGFEGFDGVAHLLHDRRYYSADELNEGPYGLDTDPPFENGTPLPRITRHGPVSIRRRWNGSMVFSRRGFASQPVDAARGKHAVMRVHRGNPRSGHDEVDEADCVCLTTEPLPRWLVEDEAAEMLEMALRHTNEIIEFGMWGASGALTHVTWLRGCAGGRGRALWPTNSPARATHVCSGISINMMDAGVAEEVRRELVEINQVFGLDVPRRHHGDLDPASAWELLRASMRAG